jgi:hypothetical protein
MYYYDLDSSLVKTATHVRFDEGMNDLAQPPPNVRLLRNLNPNDPIDANSFDMSPMNLEVVDNPFDRLDFLTPTINCDHPHLGFEISECHIRHRGYVSAIVPRTLAARIKNVRRKYIGAFVVSGNGTAVFSAEEIKTALHTASTSDDWTFEIVFAPNRYIPVAERHHDQPLHLSVEQLCVIHDISSGISSPHDPSNATRLIVRSLNTTTHGTDAEQSLGSFTRRKLK